MLVTPHPALRYDVLRVSLPHHDSGGTTFAFRLAFSRIVTIRKNCRVLSAAVFRPVYAESS
ncbi:hypothetical protein RMSM_07746 [Rhodopirellula maiorica SM1]|uniref:Uncharacterized protein n=1 Tax=Rhodopirellula maiorica SM1 TaxID=1265738 RepID=M5RMZ6_9BACT|nr:hypothetical protein RMSM_07746 [Rhodopirellula maiorica SM1]